MTDRQLDQWSLEPEMRPMHLGSLYFAANPILSPLNVTGTPSAKSRPCVQLSSLITDHEYVE